MKFFLSAFAFITLSTAQAGPNKVVMQTDPETGVVTITTESLAAADQALYVVEPLSEPTAAEIRESLGSDEAYTKFLKKRESFLKNMMWLLMGKSSIAMQFLGVNAHGAVKAFDATWGLLKAAATLKLPELSRERVSDSISLEANGRRIIAAMLKRFDAMIWKSSNVVVNGKFKVGIQFAFYYGLMGKIGKHNVIDKLNNAIQRYTGLNPKWKEIPNRYYSLGFYFGLDKAGKRFQVEVIPVTESITNGVSVSAGTFSVRVGPAFHTEAVSEVKTDGGIGGVVPTSPIPAGASMRVGNDVSEAGFQMSLHVPELLALMAAPFFGTSHLITVAVFVIYRGIIATNVGQTEATYFPALVKLGLKLPFRKSKKSEIFGDEKLISFPYLDGTAGVERCLWSAKQ